ADGGCPSAMGAKALTSGASPRPCGWCGGEGAMTDANEQPDDTGGILPIDDDVIGVEEREQGPSGHPETVFVHRDAPLSYRRPWERDSPGSAADFRKHLEEIDDKLPQWAAGARQLQATIEELQREISSLDPLSSTAPLDEAAKLVPAFEKMLETAHSYISA